MSSSRSLFKELDEFKKSKVRLGDNKKFQVKGKGTITVKTNNGNVKFFWMTWCLFLVWLIICWVLGNKWLVNILFYLIMGFVLLKIRNLAIPLLTFKWPILKCFHLKFQWSKNVLLLLKVVVRLDYGNMDIWISMDGSYWVKRRWFLDYQNLIIFVFVKVMCIENKVESLSL